MVVKALSWALRELSKTDTRAVENFMNKNDKVLAGRVKKEVWTKLRTGKKNYRRE
jgi:3-methyladenine DNA glycosylase AlkD